MDFRNCLRFILVVSAIFISFMFIVLGIRQTTDYIEERHIYELYKNTTCVITDRKLGYSQKLICGGTNAPVDTCVPHKVSHYVYYLSYKVSDGKLINSTLATKVSVAQNIFREV